MCYCIQTQIWPKLSRLSATFVRINRSFTEYFAKIGRNFTATFCTWGSYGTATFSKKRDYIVPFYSINHNLWLQLPYVAGRWLPKSRTFSTCDRLYPRSCKPVYLVWRKFLWRKEAFFLDRTCWVGSNFLSKSCL